MTNSWAGVTSSIVALLVLLLLMGVIRSLAGTYRLLTVSVAAAVLGVFFLSGEGWLERLTATDLERDQRLKVYEQTWRAIDHAPWIGYGLGSFKGAFPMFADHRSSDWDKAHNDWLELIFELGRPAALLWFAVLGGLCLRCLIGFIRRKRDHVYPAVGFCACLLVGLHALVNFSLQIPAVAVTFAVLLGVGTAQGWSSRE